MLDATGFDLAQALTKLFEKLQKWGDGLVLMLPNRALALLLAVATLAMSGWVPRLVERLLLRASANEALTRMLASLSRVGVLVMGSLWTLDLLNLEKTVTSMLAGVGVVGLALGFAFQDIAANFMSGFMMTLNRPFEVGDLVELAGRQCRVVRVQLRATEVETLDGLGILIPKQGRLSKRDRELHAHAAAPHGSAYGYGLRRRHGDGSPRRAAGGSRHSAP